MASSSHRRAVLAATRSAHPVKVTTHVPRSQVAARQLIDDVQVLILDNPRAVEVLAQNSARFRRLASYGQCPATLAEREESDALPAGSDQDSAAEAAQRLIEFIDGYTARWPHVICATEHLICCLLADPRLAAQMQQLTAKDLATLLTAVAEIRARATTGTGSE